MRTPISFADLKHDGHSCNAIPYGMAMVASSVLKRYGNEMKIALFKSPNDFRGYLGRGIPPIACFSNSIWNLNLSYAFACLIKESSPETIIIFGGPNYPLDSREQRTFLRSHPAIDFYVCREGELALVGLLEHLFACDLNVKRFKRKRVPIAGCHYLDGEEWVQGQLLPPIRNLDDIPSPYLTGLCDRFLKSDLMPLIQTARGCPFTCTYCEQGHRYFSYFSRFSRERITAELEYIAQRTRVPNLILADSNFGMYREDEELSRDVARIRQLYGWPKGFIGIGGKNRKDRVLKVASIIKGAWLSAAVQSTDAEVLKKIRRSNVSLEQMIQVAKEGESLGMTSFSEVILGLPGDTRKAHFQSVCDLIDAGLSIVRSHQFMMLPGSESATPGSRSQFGTQTRFRVIPYTAHTYEVLGKTVFTPEIDEICVGNSTMSYEDYVDCRLFNLTVEIFYNDGIFQELIKLLRLYGIRISDFILTIHNGMRSAKGTLADLYEGFLRETNELWETREALERFLQQPGVSKRFMAGEMGNNEQLMYRALAVFKHMDDLHRTAFGTAKDMLGETGRLSPQLDGYLKELEVFSLLCKKDILSLDLHLTGRFHYDFIGLAACRFNDDPLTYFKPRGMRISVQHTRAQKRLFRRYKALYGSSDFGLANVFSNASQVGSLYRQPQPARLRNRSRSPIVEEKRCEP